MRPKKGVGTTVIVAIVVVIFVAAAGAFLIVTPGLGSNPSQISSLSSTTSSTSPLVSSTLTTSGSLATSVTTLSTGSTSTSSTSTTCSSSTTTTSASSFSLSNFTSTFAAFSSMKVHLNGTFNGYSGDVTSTYEVVYASATTYKVNVNLTSGGTTADYTVWALRNGSAIAVYTNGQNYTGSYASTFYEGAMAAFLVELEFSSPQFLPAFTSGLFVHETDHYTSTLGQAQVDFTDYAPSSLPLQIDQCGVTTDFSTYMLQTGTVSGFSGTLLTNIDISGSFTANGTTENVDFGFGIISLTSAA
jgi:hypothetical protein